MPSSRTVIAQENRSPQAPDLLPFPGLLPFIAYLDFAILLPTAPFQSGPARAALLSVFLLYLVVLLGRRRAFAALEAWLIKAPSAGRIALVGIVPATVLAMSLTSVNKVRIVEALIVMLLALGMAWRQWDHRHANRHLIRALVVLALAVPLLNLVSGMLVPKLSDVATTTVDAARLLWAGHNPYAASIDPYGAANAHDPAFGGYKYLPLMIALDLPFVLPFGQQAVLWLDALTVAGLGAVVWVLASGNPARPGRSDTRWLALAITLATPELAESSLAMGYNDVIGTLLVLGAFWAGGRSAALAGLLVGCSISFKLMPGLVAMTLLFPPDRWRPYVLGLAAGLVPDALALAWDPRAFVRNVLVFNLVRSPDPTSWRLFAPVWLGRVASLGALAAWGVISLWLALGRRALSHRDPLDLRLGLFVIVVLILIMTGSTAHDDYMVWWMPAAIVLFARNAGRNAATDAAAMPSTKARLAAG